MSGDRFTSNNDFRLAEIYFRSSSNRYTRGKTFRWCAVFIFPCFNKTVHWIIGMLIPVFVYEAIKDSFRGMALFTRASKILFQPCFNHCLQMRS
ncbi:hypothetical protein B843_04300 [Corynebacterium vitaeruminis DSM 20294]|uniref:Uncharacterized protein n=1 Tax=Corynebacterium vitaeruminis DSM 20294 TaxID=1224164 RepID=W5XZX4_9CORY|nr:hypothetical protein B843_04300 [Corynebacterium vitaeruminis DSM 20294]